MKIASYGIILFFITAGATIVGTSIPPYGIASITFLPFSLVLFYVGIYYSIIAISNDISVRKYIKNSAYNELKIIGESIPVTNDRQHKGESAWNGLKGILKKFIKKVTQKVWKLRMI